MKSMNNQEFDRKVKERLDRFEAPVPLGLWNKIEQELDAHEQKREILKESQEKPLEARMPKRSTPIRGLRRMILISGSVAAMLCIGFSFWMLNDTSVIYLKKQEKQAGIEPVISEKKADESGRKLLVDVPTKPVHRPVAVQETKSVSKGLPEKSAYAREESHNVLAKLDFTNVVEGQGDRVMLVSEIALAPIEIITEQKEVLIEANEVLVLASQEAVMDVVVDDLPVHEEIKSTKNKKLGVSTLLNFLAKGFSGEEGNSIEFSENEEGILQWDIKSGLAKTLQRK